MFKKPAVPKAPKAPKMPKAPKAPKMPKVNGAIFKKIGGFFKKNRKNIIISTLLFIFLLFVNVMMVEWSVFAISLILFISVVAYLIITERNKKVAIENEAAIKSAPVKELILIDEDGIEVSKWEIAEMPALIIGKKGSQEDIDVDLSASVYANLVSREHAVMNNDGATWYVEDIGSLNGTGVKCGISGKVTKLFEGTRFPVYTGDTIYVANTKLLVR